MDRKGHQKYLLVVCQLEGFTRLWGKYSAVLDGFSLWRHGTIAKEASQALLLAGP
jgi:hypothetical protein